MKKIENKSWVELWKVTYPTPEQIKRYKEVLGSKNVEP